MVRPFKMVLLGQNHMLQLMEIQAILTNHGPKLQQKWTETDAGNF